MKRFRRPRRSLGPPEELETAKVGGLPTHPGLSPEHLLVRTRKRRRELRFPSLVAASTLDLPGDALVLGTERGGEAHVYPISTAPHIINDRLAGRPFLVTFCRRCFSGVGFHPIAEGLTLTFDQFGTYQGALTMIDEQTGTIWGQLSGEALVGPLASRRLPLTPVQVMRWKEWLSLYPGALTPDPSLMMHPWDAVPLEDEIDTSWRRGISLWDERLPARQLILGVTMDAISRAYVLDIDSPGPQLHQDELAGVPIVVLAEREAWPLAYDRRTTGRVIDLRIEGQRIVDATGSAWSGRGLAIEGPLAGMALTFVPSRICQWYAWAANYPDTEVVSLLRS